MRPAAEMSWGAINRMESMARRAATADRGVSGSLNRLSSGRRIVTAADDAAGLSISERLRAQATGSLRAQRNVEDGISLARAADAALGEVQEMLQRTRELAVRYHHGTLSQADRTSLEGEAAALGAEAGRVVAGARFNGFAYLAGGTLSVHVGSGDPDSVSTALPDVAAALDPDVFSISGVTVRGGNANANGTGNGNRGNGNGGNGNAHGHNQSATAGTPAPIARIDNAIGAVSTFRAMFGAFQNRMEHALSTLAMLHEGLVAAESRIRDADMAAEVVALTRSQITAGVGRAMAAHAQLQAHSALRLLAV